MRGECEIQELVDRIAENSVLMDAATAHIETLEKVVLEQSARINELRAALQNIARIVQFKVNAALAPEQDK